jgi:hypothetical protein
MVTEMVMVMVMVTGREMDSERAAAKEIRGFHSEAE